MRRRGAERRRPHEAHWSSDTGSGARCAVPSEERRSPQLQAARRTQRPGDPPRERVLDRRELHLQVAVRRLEELDLCGRAVERLAPFHVLGTPERLIEGTGRIREDGRRARRMALVHVEPVDPVEEAGSVPRLEDLRLPLVVAGLRSIRLGRSDDEDPRPPASEIEARERSDSRPASSIVQTWIVRPSKPASTRRSSSGATGPAGSAAAATTTSPGRRSRSASTKDGSGVTSAPLQPCR